MIDIKQIARNISLIENHAKEYENILLNLPAVNSFKGVVGITGAPGAGKSTLTDALINEMISEKYNVAVLCIDPSSPFNTGALLGDRIRMSDWYLHPNVFIRSFASRSSLGGLCPMIIEITEYLKTTGFDYIIIETVGVGQNEVEIAALADVTILTLVPEGGDEIQTMKAGIMEIADVLVVNKSDRPGADIFLKNLHQIIKTGAEEKVPIIKTTAHERKGIDELYKVIVKKLSTVSGSEKRYTLLAEKAYQLIQQKRMEDISKKSLAAEIKLLQEEKNFNLFQIIKKFFL